MNATKLTVSALVLVGVVAGILIGYLIRIKGPACVDQPPQAQFVLAFDGYVPPNANNLYNAVTVGPTGQAAFRRNMVLVDNTGCNQPQQLTNAGGTWCPGDPCSQPNMGQQVTQRVGYRNMNDLKQALNIISP